MYLNVAVVLALLIASTQGYVIQRSDFSQGGQSQGGLVQVGPNGAYSNQVISLASSVNNGYSYKEYQVITDDGFTLNLYNLQSTNCNQFVNTPVLLISTIPYDFINGPDSGIGYNMANECRDVWIGTTRNYGNGLNVNYNGNYLNSNGNDVNALDLSAQIDFILSSTTSNGVDYVGNELVSEYLQILNSNGPGYYNPYGNVIAVAPNSYSYGNQVAFNGQLGNSVNGLGFGLSLGPTGLGLGLGPQQGNIANGNSVNGLSFGLGLGPFGLGLGFGPYGLGLGLGPQQGNIANGNSVNGLGLGLGLGPYGLGLGPNGLGLGLGPQQGNVANGNSVNGLGLGLGPNGLGLGIGLGNTQLNATVSS